MHEETRRKKKRGNPIWRGVGCMVMVAVTLGGYLFSGWFLSANAQAGWIQIPAEVIRPAFAPWLPSYLIVKLIVAFLFMMLSYGIVTTIYAIVFPIELGETDSPPLKRAGPPRGR
jgi:hypothetical protein